MTPHRQIHRHDPANGIWGDCYRTAIACLLDLEPHEVPHFADRGRPPAEADELVKAWFGARRLYLIQTPYVAATATLEQIFDSIRSVNPGLHYLLGGSSRGGCNHVVVCRDDAIVHDPLPGAGIVGPDDRGIYWVMYVGRLL